MPMHFAEATLTFAFVVQEAGALKFEGFDTKAIHAGARPCPSTGEFRAALHLQLFCVSILSHADADADADADAHLQMLHSWFETMSLFVWRNSRGLPLL